MQLEQGITGGGDGLGSDETSLPVESTDTGATSGESAEAISPPDYENVLPLKYRPEATALQVEGLANCTLHVSSYDRLSQEEIEAIQEFHKTIFDGTETFRNFHKNTPTLFTFAKDENNNIIAFGLVRNYPSFTMPAFTPEKRTYGVCVIESIATRADRRNLGLSKQILDKIFSELAQNTLQALARTASQPTPAEATQQLRIDGLALDSLIVLIEVRDPDGLGKRALAVAQEHGFETATGDSAELVTNYSMGKVVLDLKGNPPLIEFRTQKHTTLNIGGQEIPSQKVDQHVYYLPSDIPEEGKQVLMAKFAEWQSAFAQLQTEAGSQPTAATADAERILTSRLPTMPDAVEEWHDEFANAVIPQLEAMNISADLQKTMPEYRLAFVHKKEEAQTA